MPHTASAPSTVFLTAADSPWGAENSLAILAGELARTAPVGALCDSQETAEFLQARGITQTILIPHVANRVRKLFVFHSEVLRRAPHSRIVLFSLQLAPLSLLLRADPRFRGRVILDVHDVPHGRFDRAASRACAHFAHRVIAISRYTRESLGLGRNSVVVPRPIMGSEPAERADFQGRHVLGIVGRLDREKRIDVAIRAVSALAEDWVLNVYGQPFLDPGCPEELHRLAEEKAPGRVVFRGVQPLSTIYSEIDCLIVCNDNEPSGRTVGEAMMHGVLPVVPDRGGASEYLPDELRHLIYTSGDPESAAAVVRTLGSGSQTSQRNTARRWVQENCSPAAVGRSYQEAICS